MLGRYLGERARSQISVKYIKTQRGQISIYQTFPSTRTSTTTAIQPSTTRTRDRVRCLFSQLHKTSAQDFRKRKQRQQQHPTSTLHQRQLYSGCPSAVETLVYPGYTLVKVSVEVTRPEEIPTAGSSCCIQPQRKIFYGAILN